MQDFGLAEGIPFTTYWRSQQAKKQLIGIISKRIDVVLQVSSYFVVIFSESSLFNLQAVLRNGHPSEHTLGYLAGQRTVTEQRLCGEAGSCCA